MKIKVSNVRPIKSIKAYVVFNTDLNEFCITGTFNGKALDPELINSGAAIFAYKEDAESFIINQLPNDARIQIVRCLIIPLKKK